MKKSTKLFLAIILGHTISFFASGLALFNERDATLNCALLFWGVFSISGAVYQQKVTRKEPCIDFGAKIRVVLAYLFLLSALVIGAFMKFVGAIRDINFM